MAKIEIKKETPKLYRKKMIFKQDFYIFLFLCATISYLFSFPKMTNIAFR